MKLLDNLCSSLCPSLENGSGERQAQQMIDGSLRFHLLGLIKSTAVWLLIATILGLVASIQRHSPSFVGDNEWFTYGKVEPMFWNGLVYGWLFNGALACAVFLIARLGGSPLGGGIYLTISAAAWNLGVTIGLIGIMRGDQTPYGLLEFPGYVSPFLLVSFVAIGFWLVTAFRQRVYRSTFASQWYIYAALLTFVWSYIVAQALLFVDPAQGVSQVIAARWYASNAQLLFVIPMALAVIYYLLPKVIGEPVVGYRYSGVTFWAWFFFASGAGVASLANGPFPAWLASVGIIATFGLLLPLTTLSIQFLSNLFRRFSAIWDSYSVRYLFVAALSFALFGSLKIYASLRSVVDTIQFSSYHDGVDFLGFCLVAGFAFSGAIFFMLPRLLNKKLPANLVDIHFWALLIGAGVVSIAFLSGGAQEGELMNQSTAEVARIVTAMRSHHFMATLGFSFILIAAVSNALIYFIMLLSTREGEETSNRLIKEAPELEYSAS